MAAPKQHNADFVLVLALFFIYAACALLLCALGANTYRETAATMQTDYNHRTGVLYIAEKARQNDIGGALRVDSFNGADALVFVEQESGRGYETWIFVAGGTLYEEFVAADTPVTLAAAQAIMPMQSMNLTSENDSLLNVALVSREGIASSIRLAARSGGGTYNTGSDAAPIVPKVATNTHQDSAAVMTQPPDSAQGGNQ
jgi:hypothetical protein